MPCVIRLFFIKNSQVKLITEKKITIFLSFIFNIMVPKPGKSIIQLLGYNYKTCHSSKTSYKPTKTISTD